MYFVSVSGCEQEENTENEKSAERDQITPFPGVQDGQNLISWRWSLPSPTDPVW